MSANIGTVSSSANTSVRIAIIRFIRSSVNYEVIVLVMLPASKFAGCAIPFICGHFRVWAVMKKRIVVNDRFIGPFFAVANYNIHVAARSVRIEQREHKRPPAVDLLLEFT